MDGLMTFPLGEVNDVYSDGSTATFEWRIPPLSQLRPGSSSSPIRKYFKTTWSLEIHKNQYRTNFVALHRYIQPPWTPETVRFSIGYETAKGGQTDVVRDQTFAWNSAKCGYYIPSTIYSPGEVTLTCTLRKDDSPPEEGVPRETRTDGASCSNATRDEHVNPGLKGVSQETQTEDAHGRNDEHRLEVLSSLSEHLKNVLLSGDGHDVLIKVQDKQFRAHKHILKARSPVFAAMFRNEMAESAEDSVTIEDCDPDAFGEFLQFVYSGAVDIASVGRALGLYHAGDKYDFPRLKEMCVEFLKNSFTNTTVFDVISLASIHDEEELLQQAIFYLSTHLGEVMRTVEWQRFLTSNPIQANEMCLKAFECKKH